MENYAAVKNAVTRNQNKNDICLLNYDNEYTRKLGENCKATVVWFSSKEKLSDGIIEIILDDYYDACTINPKKPVVAYREKNPAKLTANIKFLLQRLNELHKEDN